LIPEPWIASAIRAGGAVCAGALLRGRAVDAVEGSKKRAGAHDQSIGSSPPFRCFFVTAAGRSIFAVGDAARACVGELDCQPRSPYDVVLFHR
jgi:hypothetical protein